MEAVGGGKGPVGDRLPYLFVQVFQLWLLLFTKGTTVRSGAFRAHETAQRHNCVLCEFHVGSAIRHFLVACEVKLSPNTGRPPSGDIPWVTAKVIAVGGFA